MKRILLSTLTVAALATVATPGFTKQMHVIAGLEAAKKYHGKYSNLYIRAGSFSSNSNARNAAAIIRASTTYPVKITLKQGYHVVTIGPIASAAAVRKTAEHIPQNFKAHTSKHHVSASTQPQPAIPASGAASADVPLVPAAATTLAPDVPERMSEGSDPALPKSEPVVQAAASTNYQIANLLKMPSLPSSWKGSFYLSAGAGDLFTRIEGDNLVATGAGWPSDHYSSNDITDQPYFALAGGYMLSTPNDWLPYYSLGLRMMYASTTTISGTVEQYSLPPDFTNYNFKYDIQLLDVLATLKVDVYRWKNLMPYLIGGVGLANYSTSEYTEQALSGVTPRVSPAYGSNSGNNFSYLVGVGLDYAIFDNVWINGEFNYMDFGTVSTGKGQNYATLTGTNYDDQSLKNKISATSLFLGLTFFVS